MKVIPQEIKDNIKKHLQDGLSHRKIALKFGVSHYTVNQMALKLIPDRKVAKGGRPKLLTDRNKAYCVRQITLHGKENAREVQKSLKEDLNIEVSDSTVRRALQDMGMGSFVKPKKPHLSQKNIKRRLAWAKAHVDWTIDDWNRVIWSDETKINRFGSDGKRYTWKPDSEPLMPRHVNQTVKHGGGNIKLWSCITTKGVGYLVKIKEKLTKELYKQILEEDLFGTFDYYDMDPSKIIFQQDNDPEHTAKLVEKWLENQEFVTMDWPAQSPDLNPIENMWALLKNRLYCNYERPPNGMLELWDRTAEVWHKITAEECQKYINTMPQRCHDVIKAKGYWINY